MATSGVSDNNKVLNAFDSTHVSPEAAVNTEASSANGFFNNISEKFAKVGQAFQKEVEDLSQSAGALSVDLSKSAGKAAASLLNLVPKGGEQQSSESIPSVVELNSSKNLSVSEQLEWLVNQHATIQEQVIWERSIGEILKPFKSLETLSREDIENVETQLKTDFSLKRLRVLKFEALNSTGQLRTPEWEQTFKSLNFELKDFEPLMSDGKIEKPARLILDINKNKLIKDRYQKVVKQIEEVKREKEVEAQNDAATEAWEKSAARKAQYAALVAQEVKNTREHLEAKNAFRGKKYIEAALDKFDHTIVEAQIRADQEAAKRLAEAAQRSALAVPIKGAMAEGEAREWVAPRSSSSAAGAGIQNEMKIGTRRQAYKPDTPDEIAKKRELDEWVLVEDRNIETNPMA